MSGMNPLLAKMYGTSSIGETSHSDVEKLAQAEVLDQVLRGQGVSLDDLNGQQILKVAGELFGPGNAIEKMAGDMPPAFLQNAEKKEEKKEEGKDKDEEEKKETMEEKVAQADFLGRVMAHSMWQEKQRIEKTAASAAAPAPEEKPLSVVLQEKLAALRGETASQPSAIDVLAEARAQEILKEAQAKQPANEQEKLAAAVEARAWEMLRASGHAE